MALEIGVLNCSTAGRGTGVFGCLAALNTIKNFILTRKGWKMNIATDTLDQDKIDELIQNGDWIILPDHQSIEDASEATVYETTDSGYMIYVRDGLAQFLAQYAKGVCFHKAAHSISRGNYDVLFVDLDNEGEGRIWGEETPDGYFKGLDLNLANAENFILPTGSTSSKTPFRLQLSQKGTKALNTRFNFAKSEDVDLASIDGVRDVVLEPVSSTGTSVSLKVLGACDKTTSIVGLDASDFRVVNSAGAVQTPTAVSYANGVYTITGLTAGTYSISLYDSAANSEIIVQDGAYYASNVLNQLLSA